MNKSKFQKAQERLQMMKKMASASSGSKSVVLHLVGKMATHLYISEFPKSNATTEQLAKMTNDFLYHYDKARHNQVLVQKAVLIMLELASRTASEETKANKNILISIEQISTFGLFAQSAIGVLGVTEAELESCLDSNANVNEAKIIEMLETRAMAA